MTSLIMNFEDSVAVECSIIQIHQNPEKSKIPENCPEAKSKNFQVQKPRLILKKKETIQVASNVIGNQKLISVFSKYKQTNQQTVSTSQSDSRKKIRLPEPIEILDAQVKKKIKISENSKLPESNTPVKVEQVFEEDEITIGMRSFISLARISRLLIGQNRLRMLKSKY